MVLALITFGVVSLLELSIWLPFMWQIHKAVARIIIIALTVVSTWLLLSHISFWAILIVFFSLYRIINLLRIVEGRTHADYLYQVGRKSCFWLIGLQLIVLGLTANLHVIKISTQHYWQFLTCLSVLAALQLFYSTNRNLKTTIPAGSDDGLADRELPSITVAIPARNETLDLEACLSSLIASDYPKLEILVLDDCSQNRRTPEIIRDFAHEGVRFIAGTPPPSHWLAKNHAYSQLAEEANGQIIIFCGVDVRFSPLSLKNLVKSMILKKKTMMSVIPSNHAPDALQFESLLVQPSRYAWELALPRRWLNRPPVLSSCWMITAESFQKAGKFGAISSSISPESYFAREAAENEDGYSFIQSTVEIGLSSAKNFNEQRATAIRTRYPQLHRRPELTGLVSLAELFVLVMPYILVIDGIITRDWILAGLSIISCTLLCIFYYRIVNLTYRKALFRGIWLLPFAALYDIALLNYSMYRYEFTDVLWKGRNVCVPVMRVIPRLPRLTR